MMPELFLNINTIRIILASIMLLIASILDIKKREIHDLLWIVFGLVAVVLIFFEQNLFSSLLKIGISLLIAPVVLLAWKLGLFGGADALSLITLAALAPNAMIYGGQVTPLTTLTNAAILSISLILVNLSRNVVCIIKKRNIFDGFEKESKMSKVLAIFIGYRSQKPKFGFSMEKNNGNQKRFDFSFKHAEKTEFCNTQDTWVMPGIPYVIYITAGFFTQLIYGDMFINLFKLALHIH